MITDPYFYVVAVISVFLHGMAKGGFAGSLALLAIPMMAFFIPPFQAVAILLIPLIFMDFVTVYRYWGMWDWSIVKYIIPLGILGVIIGTITFKFMSEDHIRILVGILAIAFSLDYFLRSSNIQPKKNVTDRKLFLANSLWIHKFFDSCWWIAIKLLFTT